MARGDGEPATEMRRYSERMTIEDLRLRIFKGSRQARGCGTVVLIRQSKFKTRQFGLAGSVLRTRRRRLGPAPTPDVVNVQTKAKNVGRNEAQLRGILRNHTDNNAIHPGQYPAVPIAFANQNSGENSQQAGNVIQSQHGTEPYSITIVRPLARGAQITNVMENLKFTIGKQRRRPRLDQ